MVKLRYFCIYGVSFIRLQTRSISDLSWSEVHQDSVISIPHVWCVARDEKTSVTRVGQGLNMIRRLT